MRRTLITIVFMCATIAVAVSQTTDKQSPQSIDEQQIIALSRRFADEAVGNDATVVKPTLGTNPEIVTLVTDGEANPLAIEQIKVKIDADKATFTSQLVFSGRRANSSDTYKRVNSWTVNLIKQAGEWKIVDARVGSINK